MRPIEKFIGRQKRIMNAGTDIGINAPSPKAMIHTSAETPRLWPQHVDLIGQCFIDRGGKRRIMPGQKRLGLSQHVAHRRRRIFDPFEQLRNMAPALRGLCHMAVTLMQFRHTILRHDMAAIDRQRAFKAAPFAIDVLRTTMRRRQIHPQRRLIGISRNGRLKEVTCRFPVTLSQRLHTARIRNQWIARHESIGARKQGSFFLRPPIGTRLLRCGQETLHIFLCLHAHSNVMTVESAAQRHMPQL
ncbi:hypothetical protein [Sphingobium yanoikuyae]|uniref:hypothetical protein n=3 Tax=Sphingobium TaxID=165695 RepID=UPI0028AA424E|nr:hypothetical protein [Sphingobium yanoikuyae]